jgi:nucleoid-associated protein YgaU
MATQISSEENTAYHRSNFIKSFTVAGDAYSPYIDHFGSSYIQLFQTTVKNSKPYVVKQKDSLDMISYRFYGTTSLWWAIALASTDLVHPMLLTPGQQLRIPNKTDIDAFVLQYKNTLTQTETGVSTQI